MINYVAGPEQISWALWLAGGILVAAIGLLVYGLIRRGIFQGDLKEKEVGMAPIVVSWFAFLFAAVFGVIGSGILDNGSNYKEQVESEYGLRISGHELSQLGFLKCTRGCEFIDWREAPEDELLKDTITIGGHEVGARVLAPGVAELVLVAEDGSMERLGQVTYPNE